MLFAEGYGVFWGKFGGVCCYYDGLIVEEFLSISIDFIRVDFFFYVILRFVILDICFLSTWGEELEYFV